MSASDVAVARKLIAGDAAVIAVVPADKTVETWPILVRLARALRLCTNGPFALVRAPALDAAPRTDGAQPKEGEAFATIAVDIAPQGEIAELVLPLALGLAESARHLARALRHAAPRFPHVLVAFEGYVPDVQEALALPDAFVSAASAGRTRESDLAASVRFLPPSRHLGTLLID